MPSIKRMVQERALENPAQHVSIELSDLDGIDWARGAAFLVNEKAIHNTLSIAQKELTTSGPSK